MRPALRPIIIDCPSELIETTAIDFS
jgi:hypothetical protein